MAKPKLIDGFYRAIGVIGLPSASVLIAVILFTKQYGPTAGGGVYMVGSLLPSIAIMASSDFWNSEYSIGYVIGAVFSIVLFPSVASTLVPQPAFLGGTLLYVLSLAAVAVKIPDKI